MVAKKLLVDDKISACVKQKMERDISVRLTNMTRPVKVATFKAGPEYSGPFDVPPKLPEFWVDITRRSLMLITLKA